MPNQDDSIGDIGQTSGQPFRKLKIEVAQAGVAVPTLTRTLQNTLNFNRVNPTFARSGAGVYTITMAGAFQGNIFPKGLVIGGGGTGFLAKIEKTSANVLTLRVFDAAAAAADLVGTIFIDVEVWPA